MVCRQARDNRAARRLELGPDTPRDGSPPLSPRSAQQLASEEEDSQGALNRPQPEEAELDHPRRKKKTGDEPPRQQAQETNSAAVSAAGDESQDQLEDEVLASHDSGMTDVPKSVCSRWFSQYRYCICAQEHCPDMKFVCDPKYSCSQDAMIGSRLHRPHGKKCLHLSVHKFCCACLIWQIRP